MVNTRKDGSSNKANNFSMEELAQAVRDALLAIRQDELYTHCDLKATDLPDLLSTPENKEKLYKAIAIFLNRTDDVSMENLASTRVSKKSVKKVKKETKRVEAEVHKVLADFSSHSNHNSTTHDESKEEGLPSPYLGRKNKLTAKRTKSKRLVASRAAASPKEDDDLVNEEDLNKVEEERRIQHTLDLEKDRLLNELEAEGLSVRDNFRQIGFGKWGKYMLPVLEVGPSDVVAFALQEQWLKMARNCVKMGRKPTRLCFWYGSDSWDEAFSFIAHGQFLDYAAGVRKNFHELPATIQKKLDSGKKIVGMEKFIIQAYAEMKSELDLPPKERFRRYKEEIYDPVENVAEEDSPESELIEFVDNEPPQEPVKSGKSKKRKITKVQPQASDDDDEVIEAAPPIDEKKTKKKKKKSKPPDQKAVENELKPTSQSTITLEEPYQMEMEDIGDQNMSDEDHDDDFVSDEAKSIDDDYMGTATKKRKRKKNRTDETKAGEVSSKKRQKHQLETQGKSKNQRASGKGPIKKRKGDQNIDEPEDDSPPKMLTKAEAQGKFSRCEKQLLPALQALRTSLQNDDEEDVLQQMRFLLDHADSIIQPVIDAYASHFMRIKNGTKEKYPNNSEISALRKQIFAKMKRSLDSSTNAYPKDFAPKKKKVARETSSGKDKKTSEIKDDGGSGPPSEAEDAITEISQGDKEENPGASLETADNTTKTETTILQKQRAESGSNTPIPRQSSASRLEGARNSSDVQKKTQEAPKTAKKSIFSLKGMFCRTKTPATKATSAKSPRTPATPKVAAPVKLPSWVTETTVRDESLTDDRLLALEFLEEASSSLPTDTVNSETVIVSLESSLAHKVSLPAGTKKYWDMIHLLTAALGSGNYRGSLSRKIAEGAFSSPSDVLKLTEGDFFDLLKEPEV